MIAVLFFDKLTFHAKITSNFLIGRVENIVIDLVHPDITHLHLFFGYDTVSPGYVCARCRDCSICITAARRIIHFDAVRHGLARVNQWQIPIVIEIRQVILSRIIPTKPPRPQINLIVIPIVTVFVPAIDVDHVIPFYQAGINNPICMLQCHICEPASFGRHGSIFTSSGCTQTNRCRYHGIIFFVVLVPERHGTCVIRANVDYAADIPPLTLHTLITARTASHHPPAIPFAVPPVE